MRATASRTLFLLLASSVWSQTPANPKVLIPLIAEDNHHASVSGLSSSDLLLRDGKSTVTDFELLDAGETPLELGFVIDESNSQRDHKLPDILQAALDFVKGVVKRPDDRVFFLRFDVTPEATGWLSKEQLAGFTLKLDIGGGTALYDALASACRNRMGPRDWAKPTRRVLVVISDGDDNQSHTTRQEALSEALRSGAVIFALDTELQLMGHDRGARILQEWATLTGGRFFEDVSSKRSPKVFTEVRDLIDNMYYLTYSPPGSKDKTHEVEVKPSTKQKWTLSYPRGYFWEQ